MTLTAQVPSLDLCKRLKELGVKQESLFYWYDDNRIVSDRPLLGDYPDRYVSAFTVAELGEMLDQCVTSKFGDIWEVTYNGGQHSETSNTEADARCAMLIYLLEHNLIALGPMGD